MKKFSVKNDDINTEDMFTIKTIKTKDGGEVEFKILTIDSPEKWPIASELRKQYQWSIGNRKINMNLVGISHGQWLSIEDKAPIPDRPDEDSNEKQIEDYEKELEKQIIRKRIFVLEAATQKELPGSTIEEKEEWLSERNTKDLETIFNYISENVCCVGEGELEFQYTSALLEADLHCKVIDFNSFDDWSIAEETEHVFRFNRPGEDFIIEIPLKGLSQTVRSKIESETRQPLPPKKPKRDPKTRKFNPSDPNLMEHDYNDEGWLKTIRVLANKKMVLLFDACLIFEIPGTSVNEKYNWISNRLFGDVLKLRTFVNNELFGFKEYMDFF